VTFVVPYDGSELADAALLRASDLGAVLDERVLVVSVIPQGNAGYAKERNWLDPEEPFSTGAVVSALRERVAELSPDAEFRHALVDRHANRGSIANEIRRSARQEGASMVFIGSENAGRLFNSITSVGSSVAADRSYDVVLVRRPLGSD
jgi:nucleotide-binding universal stress UspA family protein